MEKEDVFTDSKSHMGLKIGRARRLVGLTQKDLADRLGITKQAISKLEQTEDVDDERLDKIADALGVSADGLRKFSTDNVLYYTNNYFENCGASTTNVGASNVENIHHFSIKQAMQLFEELLKMEREKFQTVTGEK